jgi:uncharacterized protein (TIGR02145 family)
MLKLKKVFRNKKILGSLLVVIGVVGFYQIFISQGSNYSWLQSDWSGGADTVAVADHTTNQTGWTKFFSKDDNVDVTSTPGEMTLISPSAENVDTTDADFNAMTQTTDLAGDGDFYINGDSIQLKKQEGASCTVDGECIGICESGFCILPCGYYTIQDADGNTYSTVEIGTQCWMGENLNIGTRINGANNQTDNSSIEKYCYSDNEANCDTYGGLYQWDEMMQYTETEGVQGICPTGWHIPTDAEQHTLDDYLATGTCNPARSGAWDCDPAGTALKETGSSGFEGKLAGYRNTDGSFVNLSAHAYFWSSSVSGSNAWSRLLYSSDSTVYRYAYDQTYGFSVRCLKD